MVGSISIPTFSRPVPVRVLARPASLVDGYAGSVHTRSVGEGAVAGAAVGAGLGTIAGAIGGGAATLGFAAFEGARIGSAHGVPGLVLGAVGGLALAGLEERYLGAGTKAGAMIGFVTGGAIGGVVGGIAGLFS
jgi:hypothetical protein